MPEAVEHPLRWAAATGSLVLHPFGCKVEAAASVDTLLFFPKNLTRSSPGLPLPLVHHPLTTVGPHLALVSSCASSTISAAISSDSFQWISVTPSCWHQRCRHYVERG